MKNERSFEDLPLRESSEEKGKGRDERKARTDKAMQGVKDKLETLGEHSEGLHFFLYNVHLL